jgi:rod shape determining protein RodA
MAVMRRGPSFDWWLFLLALALSVSGLVYIYSATWPAPDPPRPLFSEQVVYQAAYLVAALVVFFILRRINWGLKPGSWLWFYSPVMLLLLALPFVGDDKETGAVRWIDLGPFDIQPSEFAKLALTLILAWLYSGEPHEVRRRFWPALLIMLSMQALVVIQPDLGTSLVFVIIFFVMSLFAPIPRRWIAIVALYMLWAGLLAWQVSIPLGLDKDGKPRHYQFVKDYQKQRIMAFLDPQQDPTGSGYHIIQSENAVGGGGLSGQGFLRGTQVHGGFIPVVHADFIFTVVGEEYGFVGCVWLLLLYFLLLARVLALSRDALSVYERYICYGTSAVVFFHVFIAIGMTIRLAPITGLPLPFVSAGGTALMTMWLYMAILQSIHANSRRDFRYASRRR